MTSTIEKIKTYLNVVQLSERHPAFSISALRHLMFNAKSNGFDSVIFRIGRKCVLEESAFEHWILEQQKKGGK